MENELYVKAWFLLIVAGMLIATSTGAAIYFVESQNTQNLLNKMANNFETQLISMQTNQSLALSQLATDFAALNIESTETLAQQALEISNLTAQAISLQTTIDAQIVTYNELYVVYNVTLGEKNSTMLQLNETIIWLQEKSQELNETLEQLHELQNLSDAYHLHDLNLEDVTTFIAEDLTNEREYIADVYTSINYVADVDNNATNLGIRCGILFFYNATDVSYFNVFDIIDNGIVFVATDDVFFNSILEIEAIYDTNIRYFTAW